MVEWKGGGRRDEYNFGGKNSKVFALVISSSSKYKDTGQIKYHAEGCCGSDNKGNESDSDMLDLLQWIRYERTNTMGCDENIVWRLDD